ncbi:MAG: NINE protein [Bacteroidota bacterium]|nr:NINE protein [Bacteroidota bacterium]MDP3145648.1 NINE protein [Bacteroidota bacterium]MDP3558677.1 NINE protein [Bacteroidota bacterium]
MSLKGLFIALCFLFLQKNGFGLESTNQKIYFLNADNEIIDSCSSNINYSTIENKNRPNPLLHLFKAKQKKNKRITAAILAFPFPFGIVGLHRIYLGTAPYVPIAYIASLGGIFGILPFIDFCVLILDKDEARYINNKKVFMWVN